MTDVDMSGRFPLRAIPGCGHPCRAGARPGFTLIEIMVTLVILVLLAAIALPYYGGHLEKVKIAQASADIRDMEVLIGQYLLDNRVLPSTLADIGRGTLLDPWKHPYRYLKLSGDKSAIGSARKDKNLVPINSDYDLYSMGADGATATALTAQRSRDDIIRANDGRFVGLGGDY